MTWPVGPFWRALALCVLVPGALFGEEPARTDHFGDPLPSGARLCFGTLRWRHPGVRFVFYAPDGKTLLSVSHDGSVHQWDVGSGRQLRVVYKTEQNRISDASCSADGQTLLLVED